MNAILNTPILCVLVLTLSFSSAAQNTVGLMSYDTEQVEEGYNLIFPQSGNQDTWLLDNCGRICKFWDGDSYGPGNQVFLGENGLLYKAIGNAGASNQWFHAGGGGEGLEIRDVNDNITWQYFLSDSIYRFHHDFSVMPNGNILAIAWERHFETDCLANGADPARLLEGEIWSEVVYEIEPVGSEEANIVWEWHAWDHLVQDFDEAQDNFGVVGDNPFKININFTPDSVGDWLHCNAIDYNANLDQIALSIPTFNEIWIIDHSTSTEQAATSSGGLAGRGGDLIYRWGNPRAYDQGTTEDQILHYQHHIHWLDRELPVGHPDYGKLGVFSNRLPDNSSEVLQWFATFDDYEWEYPLTDGVWGPSAPEWTYTTEDPVYMYSTILSSMQRLQNGNTLIGVGRWGRSFEINPEGDIVWEYRLPLQSGSPVAQGTELGINANFLWRASRYTPDYAGLDGWDLTPMGYIELDPDTTVCPLITSVEEITVDLDWTVYPNPVQHTLQVVIGQQRSRDLLLAIYNAQSALVLLEKFVPVEAISVSLEQLPAGAYTVAVKSAEFGQHTRVIVKE